MEFLIGIFVGGFLYWVFAERKRSSGSFIVNMSDPMDETLKIEMYDSISEVCSKKQILLDVKILNEDSLK